jgi:hypothetical protein
MEKDNELGDERKSKAEKLKSKENWKRLYVIERFFLLLGLSYTRTLKPI